MQNMLKSILRVTITILIIVIVTFVIFFRKEIFIDNTPISVAIWTLKLEIMDKEYILIWKNKYIVKYDFDLIDSFKNEWYKYIDSDTYIIVQDKNNIKYMLLIKHYFSNYRIYEFIKID